MKKIKVSRISKAITLFIVLSCVAALASTVLYEKKGVSEFLFQEDPSTGRTIEKTMDEFEVRRQYNPSSDEEILYLVSSKKKITEYFDAEGLDGTISWEVRRGNQFENSVWSSSEQATELAVHWTNPVMVTGLGGCCAELTGYRLYDYRNGLLLLSFNDFEYSAGQVTQPYSLEIPNSQLSTRYIGVLSGDSTRDADFQPPAPGMESAILVAYANEGPKQKFQVDMQAAPGYGVSIMSVTLEKDPNAPDSDKIEFYGKQATLWNIDGSNNPKDIQGVQLKVVLNAGEGDKTLILPIKEDQFDLSRAKPAKGVMVRAINARR